MAGEARGACGVVGIYAPGEDVARLTYYGLYAQHRGQESAGIAISDGQTILVYKELGLVAQAFDETVLQSLRGFVSIGHTRYSTTGSTSWDNAQPTYKSSPAGQIALAHNGNLVNSVELAATLKEAGGDPTPEAARLRSTSDTDLVAAHSAGQSGRHARRHPAGASQVVRRLLVHDDERGPSLSARAIRTASGPCPSAASRVVVGCWRRRRARWISWAPASSATSSPARW